MPRTILILVLGCAVLLGGCETAVDATVDSDRSFSLYGVLQPRADTQWVRVYPIEDQLTPTPATPLDATVRSTVLETGQTQTWRDSVVQDPSGENAHVYWRPFRVDHGRTYRLEVTGPQGRARVEVDVPDSAELVLQPPEVNSAGVFTPVFIDRAVPRLLRPEVEYFFQYDFSRNSAEPPLLRASRSYDGAQRREDGGWIVPINLVRDFLILREQLDDADLWNPLHGLVMVNMTLRLAVVNEAWDPPGGSFDPEVLVQPGTLSNVENGFGFVGAGYRLEETWTPDMETLTTAGWTDPGVFQ
jgi:hypothetical protein